MEEEEEKPAAGSVRVKREVLAACMTCPLCHKLFRDATTISECLHTCEPPINLLFCDYIDHYYCSWEIRSHWSIYVSCSCT